VSVHEDQVFKHEIEFQINGGCNSDGPKVAKFLGG